ncbi:acyl-CoA N-acyltransferase [Infundibulicybe gibba]|nr:acyl-CoA N-acyltransferase [Infundibulicybe gibba]
MPPSQKQRVDIEDEDIIDTTGVASDSDHDGEDHSDAGATPSTSQKKKKKKSKATRALNAIRGKPEIPDELVHRLMDEVGSQAPPGMTEDNLRQALEQLKIMDVAKGKSGLGGINSKNMGEHKFWSTQPVPQPGEDASGDDGFIEPSKPREEVRQDPYPLPNNFEWSILDIDDPNQNKEVYDLLSLNYVEDEDASFRFQYTAEFLQWALKPPGYHKEWHIGVRVSSNKKLVAFISGVPITLRVRNNSFPASEINYLCVHKKLRSKRLAPVHLKGVFQAIYTAGAILPTPVSVCRYYHRSLNVQKLVDIKFCYVPRNMTLARMINVNKLPTTPTLGIREMQDGDVPQVANLFTQYMKRFEMIPTFTTDEIGSGGEGRREGQVTWTYVVENPQTHQITDFFSFYSLPSTVIHNPRHGILEAAYLYYYATDLAFDVNAESEGRLKHRLQTLVGDALVVAHQAKFDVFNALTLMDNVAILQDLKFGVGDGFLNFYLYNWRTPPLSGVNAVGGASAGKGVGVVML